MYVEEDSVLVPTSAHVTAQVAAGWLPRCLAAPSDGPGPGLRHEWVVLEREEDVGAPVQPQANAADPPAGMLTAAE